MALLLTIFCLFVVLSFVQSTTVSPCTFAQINASIAAAVAGDTLDLQCAGVTVNFPQVIVITKSVTLNGNNGTFNGQGTTRFFAVGPRAEWGVYDATGIAFGVKNIIFQNGFADGYGLLGEREAGWGAQIKDGSGNVIYWPIRAGGAIVVGPAANLTVDSCQFLNCQTQALAPAATTSSCANCALSYEGGAIKAFKNNFISITNSVFIGNIAADGGAVHIGAGCGYSCNGGTLTMTNCIFDSNVAKIGMGGGLFTTSKNTISRVTFLSNDAMGEGGGMSLGWQSDVTTVDRGLFLSNLARPKDEAGAGGLFVHESKLKITNSRFVSNRASLGGGIRCLLADLDISDTIFSQNRAELMPGGTPSASGLGGGIYVDGAMANNLAAPLNGGGHHYYTRVYFEQNYAYQNGGGEFICEYIPTSLANHQDTMLFNLTRFCGNTIDGDTSAAISPVCEGDGKMYDSIMGGNTAKNNTGGFFNRRETVAEYETNLIMFNTPVPGWNSTTSPGTLCAYLYKAPETKYYIAADDIGSNLLAVSSAPTPAPTKAPTTPTNAPTSPTNAPTSPTNAPTLAPTAFPSANPTPAPTPFPTFNPTNNPTPFPSANPTPAPTAFPTPAPTSPTQAPTQYPVGTPTEPPSNAPSLSPSAAPTPFPTQSPTGAPTPFPTPGPTAVPTEFPTSGPTPAPTPFPTQAPTNPTQAPTNPTSEPSAAPSFESAPIEPTTVLTNAPTEAPVTGNTCWDLDVMSRVFNSDIARIQTLWNSDAKMVQAGLYVAFIAPSTVSNNHLTSRVDINLASLTDQEVATLCDAIRRELDADFGSASSCWKYSCWAAKKRQLGTTSVNFDLSPPDSSFPVWIVVVAVIGGLILLALIIVAVVLFMKKQKKSSSEWEKY